MYCIKPLVTVSMDTKLYYHENGNVGLHVCAKFHDHTYMQWFKGNNMYIIIVIR